MIQFRPFRTPGSRASALIACILLAGCAGLPEPDGIEAAIIERSRGLAPLALAQGSDSRSTTRNGLLRSPSVREAASRVSASADEVRVKRAALFPGLGLSLGGGAGAAGSGDPALQLEASQLLFDSGNSKRTVEVADFDLEINYIAFQKAVDDAALELLKAYDDVQTRGELLDVYRKQMTALRELEAWCRRGRSAARWPRQTCWRAASACSRPLSL